MEANKIDNDNFSMVSELEKHINGLLDKNDHLLEENHTLKQQHESISAEKAILLERNRKVTSKIETILSRLKTLEKI